MSDALMEKETLVYTELRDILGDRPFGLHASFAKYVTASGNPFDQDEAEADAKAQSDVAETSAVAKAEAEEYDFNGKWTIRWLNGETEAVVVKDGEFEVFGERYTLQLGENHVHFVWPDGCVQSVKISSPERIEWVTDNADPSYRSIYWERREEAYKIPSSKVDATVQK